MFTFQNLIGMLGRARRQKDGENRAKFQNLIGMLGRILNL